MDIDTNRARELLNNRDEIDAELAALFAGQQTKKPIKCGTVSRKGIAPEPVHRRQPNQPEDGLTSAPIVQCRAHQRYPDGAARPRRLG